MWKVKGGWFNHKEKKNLSFLIDVIVHIQLIIASFFKMKMYFYKIIELEYFLDYISSVIPLFSNIYNGK